MFYTAAVKKQGPPSAQRPLERMFITLAFPSCFRPIHPSVTLDSIRHRLEKLLIETDGHPEPHNLAPIVADAKAIGLDDRQIARLVPDVDRRINWEAIRAEKAAEARQEEAQSEVERIRREDLEAAPQLLSALVQSLLARGYARGEEIRAILDRAETLEQSPHALARQIKSGMDIAKWAPWPPVDLNARTIAELLASTDWYAPAHYPHQASAAGQPVAGIANETSQSEQSITASASTEDQPILSATIKDATPQTPSTGSFRPQSAPETSNVQPPTSNAKRRSWSVFWLLPFVIAAGYYFFLRPYLRDKAAPRYYTIAEDAVLRSSAISSDDNKIETLPYGTELIGYGAEGGWSEVKHNNQPGYVATRLLAEKKDYYLLNSIFGNPEAKEVIPTSRARRALLEYYKQNGIAGDMPGEVKKEIFGTAFPRADVWMVYAKPADSPRNVVLYTRVVKPGAKHPDFAVLITKQAGAERKALLFSFSEEGDATLEEEQAAPKEGTLVGVSKRKGKGESRYVFSYR